MTDDYRSAKTYKEKPENKSLAGVNKERWWEVSSSETAQYVLDTGSSLKMDSSTRLEALVRHARVYENCDFDSLMGRDFTDSAARQIALSYNLMTRSVGAACVDTLTAKITKNSPRPYFLTSGASWTNQIKARSLDRWCKGYFYETKIYKKARQVFVDACEFGTGFLHIFDTGNGKLDCERVLPSEIFIDDLDGKYGEPRQMMRLKYVSKDVLCRIYPKHVDSISKANKREILDVHAGDTEIVDDIVEVWEAWHLPSGEGAEDGKHVICIEGATLYEEAWKICHFPFIVMRYKSRTTGYWGKGLIESTLGLQLEINRTIKSISQQIRRKGKGRTFIPIGSKIVKSHLTNADGGDVVMYAGNSPPSVDNSNAVAQEDFAYLEWCIRSVFQDAGISELSASAKKPAGLDAAVALREYSDIESERFALQHKDWENFFLEFAETSIALITKQMGWREYRVLVPGRRDLLEVDWSDIDLERDDYIMQLWPVSSLPQTPGARLQRVTELKEQGYIDKPTAQRLLEFPDLDAETNLSNAVIDDVDATISAILDNEEPELMPLEPYQNLELLVQRANASYLYARHRKCPEERLALLRNLIDNATAQLASLSEPLPMPGMPVPGDAAPTAGAAPNIQMDPMMSGGLDISNNVNVPIQPAVPPMIAGQ